MHPNATGHETLRARLERDVRAIAELLADPDLDQLVWEQLPNGEWTYLRPEPRIVITDKGRAAIAEGTA